MSAVYRRVDWYTPSYTQSFSDELPHTFLALSIRSPHLRRMCAPSCASISRCSPFCSSRRQSAVDGSSKTAGICISCAYLIFILVQHHRRCHRHRPGAGGTDGRGSRFFVFLFSARCPGRCSTELAADYAIPEPINLPTVSSGCGINRTVSRYGAFHAFEILEPSIPYGRVSCLDLVVVQHYVFPLRFSPKDDTTASAKTKCKLHFPSVYLYSSSVSFNSLVFLIVDHPIRGAQDNSFPLSPSSMAVWWTNWQREAAS